MVLLRAYMPERFRHADQSARRPSEPPPAEPFNKERQAAGPTERGCEGLCRTHAGLLANLYRNEYIPHMQTFSTSDARANLKAVMDKVVADKAPIAISRQKGEGVVMISQSEWDSIEETLYLLRSPNNAKRLLESIAELDAGKGEEHDLIEP